MVSISRWGVHIYIPSTSKLYFVAKLLSSIREMSVDVPPMSRQIKSSYKLNYYWLVMKCTPKKFILLTDIQWVLQRGLKVEAGLLSHLILCQILHRFSLFSAEVCAASRIAIKKKWNISSLHMLSFTNWIEKNIQRSCFRSLQITNIVIVASDLYVLNAFIEQKISHYPLVFTLKIAVAKGYAYWFNF